MSKQKVTFSRFFTFRFPLFTFYSLLKNLFVAAVLLALFSSPTSAQLSTSMGLPIQLIGMVQVEPGANVITLSIKETEIRFQAQDVASGDRDFSVPQFLSDIQRRSPNMTISGPEHLLDLLLEEKPKKRVMKLSGIYYNDARRFVVNKISTVSDNNRPQF